MKVELCEITIWAMIQDDGKIDVEGTKRNIFNHLAKTCSLWTQVSISDGISFGLREMKDTPAPESFTK